eukprot:1202181-Rhodomonas_salina.2
MDRSFMNRSCPQDWAPAFWKWEQEQEQEQEQRDKRDQSASARHICAVSSEQVGGWCNRDERT